MKFQIQCLVLTGLPLLLTTWQRQRVIILVKEFEIQCLVLRPPLLLTTWHRTDSDNFSCNQKQRILVDITEEQSEDCISDRSRVIQRGHWGPSDLFKSGMCVIFSCECACVCIQYSCYDCILTVELTSCLRAKITWSQQSLGRPWKPSWNMTICYDSWIASLSPHLSPCLDMVFVQRNLLPPFWKH